MPLTTFAGNSQLKQRLAPRLSAGLAHAYILSGPAGSGRHTLAAILARAMVCSDGGTRPCGLCPGCKKAAAGIHPDIITVSREADHKEILVDQVRQMRSDAFIRPNEAARKVYIIEDADSLNENAQNAMLKLLEEGPAYAAFLLLVENPGSLLITVRSRCEELALGPVSVPEAEQWLAQNFPQQAPDLRRQAALDCQGVLGRAVDILNGGRKDSAELDRQARQLAEYWLAGDEQAMMTLCIPMEKWDRQQFFDLLERMRVFLCGQLPGHPDPRRVLRAVELTQELSRTKPYNMGLGHLTGWLCAQAGMP
ncbi:MAG: DNA polymerase III subunit delta [Oscillospiraceae bacterium]|nr:DNA polymerase III subunit delta [Oscillospiraceae bacterium]